MKGGDNANVIAAAAPAPVIPGIPVLPHAGTGQPSLNTTNVSANTSISSKGNGSPGLNSGPYSNLGAEIVNSGGYDLLRFNMAPSASVITNQDTLSYMDGGLSTGATTGTGGLFGALFRGIAGSSILQNSVVNPTSNTLKMILSPLLQGSIVQVDIQAGETWRFADKSFIAATPNLVVSGNINIFSNFRMMFVGENLTYTTVSASQGTAGTVWVSSYGAVEKHEINMGTGSTVPLFINNGCFMGMLDNDGVVDFWNDYVSVGTANGFFSAMFTQLGWIMKIQDTNPPRRPGPLKVTVLTQSLNPHNLEKYIANIAQKTVSKMIPQGMTVQGTSFLTSGIGPSANPSVLGMATMGLAGAAAVPAATQMSSAIPGLYLGLQPGQQLTSTAPVVNVATQPLQQPAVNTTQPTMNTTQPTMNTAQPAVNTAQPTMNIFQPTMNISEPMMNTTQPIMNTTQPIMNTLQPTMNWSGNNRKQEGFTFGGATRRRRRARLNRNRTQKR